MATEEWTGALIDWRAELEALKARLAPALGRAETLVLRARDHPAFTCAWSRWRRHHQATAARCHPKRRT